MRAANGGPNAVAANFAFTAFFFSICGWALLELQLFNLAAGILGHLVVSACGCAVSGVALRRCRSIWPSFTTGAVVELPSPNRYRFGDVAACAALVGAGCFLAVTAKLGSAAVFAVFAGIFSLVPWSRISLCRKHFVISWAMLFGGVASAFFIVRGSGTFLSDLFCTWFLWIIATSELIITLRWELPATSGTKLKLQHATGPQLENLAEHR